MALRAVAVIGHKHHSQKHNRLSTMALRAVAVIGHTHHRQKHYRLSPNDLCQGRGHRLRPNDLLQGRGIHRIRPGRIRRPGQNGLLHR